MNNLYFKNPKSDIELIDIIVDICAEIGIFKSSHSMLEFLDKVVKHNPSEWIEIGYHSKVIQPYHMWRHMFDVAFVAYQTVKEIGEGDLRLLIPACLLHDYGHSLGLCVDKDNIEYACMSALYLLQDYTTLNRDQIIEIINIILDYVNYAYRLQ